MRQKLVNVRLQLVGLGYMIISMKPCLEQNDVNQSLPVSTTRPRVLGGGSALRRNGPEPEERSRGLVG